MVPGLLYVNWLIDQNDNWNVDVMDIYLGFVNGIIFNGVDNLIIN